MTQDTDFNKALHQRIVATADEYHAIAEEQWNQLIELNPATADDEFEFRRIVRAALQFYARAYLVLQMVETVAEQQIEELLEIVLESEPEMAAFVEKNDAVRLLDEDAHTPLSHVFSIAEALRSFLLDRSNSLAATLAERFSAQT